VESHVNKNTIQIRALSSDLEQVKENNDAGITVWAMPLMV
jgi:hypothetical protein